MTVFLHLLILVTLTFCARILPRIFLPRAFSTDTYYHMLCAQGIRDNHFKIPTSIKGFCFPSIFDYPPLFPFVLALFGRETREKIEKYVSACIDVILVVSAYLFGNYMFSILHPALAGKATLLAFLSGILYALSPALLFFGYGPRAYQATPRTLSELLFFLLAVSVFNSFFNASKIFFLISVILCALLLLSSKFGAQALLFFSLMMSVFMRSFYFLSVPLLGFVVAVMVTRGYYLKVLKGQIGHLILFKKITSKVYPFIQRKNRLQDIISLLKDMLCKRKKAFGTIFFNNTFIIALTRNPQLILLAFWILSGNEKASFVAGQKTYFMLTWILSSLLAFLLTSQRPFLFLGEAERYITYSLMPQYVFLAIFCFQSGFFTWIYSGLIIYSLVLYAAYVFLFIKWHATDKETVAAKEEVFGFLNNYPQKLRLLPITEDTYELAYKSGQDVLYPPGNYRIDYVSPEEFRRLYEVFDSPNPDIDYILNKYNLNAVFVSERQISYLKKSFNMQYDFCKFRNIFQNKKFRVYQRL